MPASAARRVAAAAAVTAVAALAFLLPGTIHAEDEGAILHTFLHGVEETALGDEVVGASEVVRDPNAKSGWGVEVTLANPTDARRTARLSVALQKTFFNPVGRTSTTPLDVWAVP